MNFCGWHATDIHPTVFSSFAVEALALKRVFFNPVHLRAEHYCVYEILCGVFSSFTETNSLVRSSHSIRNDEDQQLQDVLTAGDKDNLFLC